DNVRDHQAGTVDHPFLYHAQVRLRVHHIVIPRISQHLICQTRRSHMLNKSAPIQVVSPQFGQMLAVLGMVLPH
ncbi:MAG: hypothetical protein OSA89_03025, partial [Mariniblastus sp.]|nr:hypothetical protein [Mariniblastus sp.]